MRASLTDDRAEGLAGDGNEGGRRLLGKEKHFCQAFWRQMLPSCRYVILFSWLQDEVHMRFHVSYRYSYRPPPPLACGMRQ